MPEPNSSIASFASTKTLFKLHPACLATVLVEAFGFCVAAEVPIQQALRSSKARGHRWTVN